MVKFICSKEQALEEWEEFVKSKECDEQFIELLKQFGLIDSEDEEADYRRRLKLSKEKRT